MCVYTCISLSIHIKYIYIYIYIHTYTYAYIYIMYIHIHIYIYIYVYIYICMYMLAKFPSGNPRDIRRGAREPRAAPGAPTKPNVTCMNQSRSTEPLDSLLASACLLIRRRLVSPRRGSEWIAAEGVCIHIVQAYMYMCGFHPA